MITDIILDVDGVIIGEKIGFNSPWPHQDVIAAMKKIRQNGVFIHLCTAKPYWAVEKIIRDAKLNNVHIIEGGAVLMDPIDNIILEKHIIPPNEVAEVLQTCLSNTIYVEIYDIEDYFIQSSEESEITKKHAHVLQRSPQKIQSIVDFAQQKNVVKVMPVARDEEDKRRVDAILAPFREKLSLSWAVHPVVLPLQFGIITAKGISKKEGGTAILKHENSSFETTLSVGDSTSDWQFIGLSKYKAAMGNASQELKELVRKSDNSYIGKSVNEHGIIDIFRHFQLL
jgi:hydroxymethylpyrimidine pyrophosphatase-like HAD family hydrolase